MKMFNNVNDLRFTQFEIIKIYIFSVEHDQKHEMGTDARMSDEFDFQPLRSLERMAPWRWVSGPPLSLKRITHIGKYEKGLDR